ncbi:hypothetical protein GCM10011505_14350 [Tistrella bauzanensis]|uniref:Uncharacterized protein n=1 Tax=Tistrella bauzanensis TaxID=657419 RepID=A0ABQ1IBZ4_9PROT|nr:hypothetical protein GCM10011505_14350 [Tistrella bauzanensis]
MGEVRNFHRAIDQCHAKGNQAVDTAQDQTVHDLLGKQLHLAHPSQGVPGRGPAGGGCLAARILFRALRSPAPQKRSASEKSNDAFLIRSNVQLK